MPRGSLMDCGTTRNTPCDASCWVLPDQFRRRTETQGSPVGTHDLVLRQTQQPFSQQHHRTPEQYPLAGGGTARDCNFPRWRCVFRLSGRGALPGRLGPAFARAGFPGGRGAGRVADRAAPVAYAVRAGTARLCVCLFVPPLACLLAVRAVRSDPVAMVGGVWGGAIRALFIPGRAPRSR